MSDSPLFWTVYERLVGAKLPPPVAELVEAAFGPETALSEVLAGAGAGKAHSTGPAQRPPPKRSFLKSLEVSGFRGIGPRAALELAPGPGLTLVTGRNGCGKSSFAEGLEVLLTGDVRRMSSRTTPWRSGWRNLHPGGGPVEVKATFLVEGAPPAVVTRRWAEGVEDLSSSTVTGLTELGWSEAIVTHRPLLSYAELGALLEDGPSKLYDSLKAILGLEELGRAIARLSAARTERERLAKDTRAKAKEILGILEGSTDPRKQACVEALSQKSGWKLDVLEGMITDATPHEGLDLFRRLLRVSAPELDPEPLREALRAQAELADTNTSRQLQAVKLLEHALAYHPEDGVCGVCGVGLLDAAWREKTKVHVAELREGALAAHEVGEAVRSLARALQPPPPPSDLARVPEAAALLSAWRALADAPTDPAALADHVEARLPALAAALAPLKAWASEQVRTMEDGWRPVREAIAGWLPAARKVKAQEEETSLLKEAETWLKSAEGEIQADRFAPISTQAKATWERLRQESSVTLAGVRLDGQGNRRNVAIEVGIDGSEGRALGVMSQGEVNALALSLFLPRLTHPDSPFSFVVIDDPVQSMDPFKVDGLAQVLQAAAVDRQVIVFTHDARLSEAVRRMQIPATILQVNRGSRSAVSVKPTVDPVEQQLKDAYAVAKSEEAGPKVHARVVPGLCRQAVDALFIAAFRRKELAAGRPREEVEERLRSAKGSTGLAALAIFGDEAKGAQVLGWLHKNVGAQATDTFKALKEGAHGSAGDVAMVQATGILVKRLREVL